MDVERIIDDIEQLQEMFEAPDIRPLSASDISVANRRHDEMIAQSPWFRLWQDFGVDGCYTEPHTCSYTLTDGTGTLYRTAYLHFLLVNCGDDVPVVPSSTTIVQDTLDLRPATPGGSISATILGNDQIHCGNVKSTYYTRGAAKIRIESA